MACWRDGSKGCHSVAHSEHSMGENLVEYWAAIWIDSMVLE